MKNEIETIKAVPTACGLRTNLDGIKNILTDAFYEMGYDDTLVDALIERNVVDFSNVNDVSDVMGRLIEHYGESVLCGGLPNAVICESLDACLTGELGRNWRTSKGDTFRERILNLITTQIASLGLKTVNNKDLETTKLGPELSTVMRNLVVDYGEFGMYLPESDIVIYNPKNSQVIAIISYNTSLKVGVTQAGYWKHKLKDAGYTKHIKVYLLVFDANIDSTKYSSTVKSRVVAEADMDGAYILTAEDLKKPDRFRFFEQFIIDLIQVIKQNQ